MKQYGKFKVGDKVKITKAISTNNCFWISPDMDEYIGKVLIIDWISDGGNYGFKDISWVFPPQSLVKGYIKNEQLLFDFMLEKGAKSGI